MYSDYYGLTGRPFQITPDPKFYFDTQTHRKAMAYLSYGLSQGEGFIIITGDVGAGKTTLVGHLMESIDRATLVTGKIVTTQLDGDALLRMVATAFGIFVQAQDKAALLTAIEAFLRQQHKDGRRALLIVDEAQNLSISALEELRMLSNFQADAQALLQIFLLAQPEFRDKISFSAELEQLRQRVIATHHLEPMAQEELPSYVEHRLALCGWQGRPIFTPAAYDLMYEYSGGVPRRLNNLASRILLLGALDERNDIDADLVQDVIEDLRKDNTPTTGPKPQLQSQGDFSGIGPLAASALIPILQNISLGNMGDSPWVQRLENLEACVHSHDQSLKEIIDLLSFWAENAPSISHGEHETTALQQRQ